MAPATAPTKVYAHLDVINYEKIKDREPVELQRLLHSSKSDGGRGLFFLDLRGPTAGETLSDARSLYDAAAQFFDTPSDRKKLFHKDGVDAG